METRFIDQYAILHFSAGVIAYFLKIDISLWFILHAIFELIQGTRTPVPFINKNILSWPSGVYTPETMINRLGDQLMATLGWLCAYWLDKKFS